MKSVICSIISFVRFISPFLALDSLYRTLGIAQSQSIAFQRVLAILFQTLSQQLLLISTQGI